MVAFHKTLRQPQRRQQHRQLLKSLLVCRLLPVERHLKVRHLASLILQLADRLRSLESVRAVLRHSPAARIVTLMQHLAQMAPETP